MTTYTYTLEIEFSNEHDLNVTILALRRAMEPLERAATIPWGYKDKVESHEP